MQESYKWREEGNRKEAAYRSHAGDEDPLELEGEENQLITLKRRLKR